MTEENDIARFEGEGGVPLPERNTATPNPAQPDDGTDIDLGETDIQTFLEGLADQPSVDIGAVLDVNGIQVVINIPWDYIARPTPRDPEVGS